MWVVPNETGLVSKNCCSHYEGRSARGGVIDESKKISMTEFCSNKGFNLSKRLHGCSNKT